MTYDDYSLDELLDVFIQIDDQVYAERALQIYQCLATKLKISADEIKLEQIIAVPTENYLNQHNNYFASGALNYIGEVYTDDAIVVRDKLLRLKKLLINH